MICFSRKTGIRAEGVKFNAVGIAHGFGVIKERTLKGSNRVRWRCHRLLNSSAPRRLFSPHSGLTRDSCAARSAPTAYCSLLTAFCLEQPILIQPRDDGGIKLPPFLHHQEVADTVPQLKIHFGRERAK